MGALATAPLTIDEYLGNPRYERCEYVDGRAVEINVGSKKHSRIQSRLARYLDIYLEENPIGYSAAELRCRIELGSRTRFRLPDICAAIGDDSPDSDYLERTPDFVVEIRSQDDSISSLSRKMEEYLAAGTRLGWLVIPEEKSVFVFSPNRAPYACTQGETLDGGDVLPGFTVAIDRIFKL